MAEALGAHPAETAAVARCEGFRLDAQRYRRFRPGPAGTRRTATRARSGPHHADSPRHARSDRPAADAGRGGRLPRRHVAAMPTKRSSIACWPRRATANAWRCAGSTPPATPTPTATKATANASCGAGATGSSTPSTATCRSTSSPSSSWPATCCRSRRWSSGSPPASTATIAATPKAASSPRNTPSSTSSIASRRRPRSGSA